MLLISRGRGALVAVIAFGSLLASDFLTARYFSDEKYYQEHGWPKLTGFVAAAVIVKLLSPRGSSDEYLHYPLDRTHSPERRKLFRKEDSLFLIPVRYWPLILCTLGVVFYYY